MNKKVDYLIVGQGLAGSILALTLMKGGKSVVIVDDAKGSTASKVAAGLFNPIVFKRLVKSWLADELLPFMNTFYPEMEILLGTKFYFSKQILKPFSEEQERTLWTKKTEEPVGKYLSKDIYTEDMNGIVYNPLGISEVLHTGNLDTISFLNSFNEYLRKKNLFVEEKFDFAQVQLLENSVSYKEFVAGKIIFCEGYKATENPFFKWLPFKLTKGETITIKLQKEYLIPMDIVINKAVFILPLGDNTYKVGATYEWENLTEIPTEKGRSELVEKLQKVLKIPFEIIDQQAGIRPTVNDRRPLIGLHPKYPQIAIFNGLGTKGVMLAPFFADQFFGFLENSSPLHNEVNIARFKF
jgi:glycine/D-amino acid oxidase-like deaminating enzyme